MLSRIFLAAVCSCLISSGVLAADPSMRFVQEQLTRLGFYYGEIDGEGGPETEAAIRRYQIRNGLPVTGTLTSETLAKLGGGQKLSPSAGSTPPNAAGAIVKSDRDFLKKEAVPPATGSVVQERPVDAARRGGSESSLPPGNYVRDEGMAADLDGFDLLFTGTPYERAGRNVQRRLLVQAQRILHAQQYYGGAIDGIPGKLTTRAILDFQSDLRIPATGILDVRTMRSLQLSAESLRRAPRYYRSPPSQRVYRGQWVR